MNAMLSRVADSLYWMSRYLERADHVARQLDVHLTIVTEQAFDVARRRRRRMIACLVDKEEHAAAETSDYELANLLTFDQDNPSSIANCIASARENARQVREQINSQMWEQINQMYLTVHSQSMQSFWDGQPHSFYHWINQEVYRFQGITDSRITRDQGWHFIQIGRYLERASETADSLNVDFRELYASGLEIDAIDQQTYLDWVGLLRGCAAYEAYSKVYAANVQPRHIVEFLLLNPNFPYSVHFGINRIQSSLQFVGEETETPKSARVYRLGGRLRAMLDYAQIDEIMESGLGSYLLNI
ncbi:MAG: alpha-E domain-containing protein, partial [Caldilinea sp.]